MLSRFFNVLFQLDRIMNQKNDELSRFLYIYTYVYEIMFFFIIDINFAKAKAKA